MRLIKVDPIKRVTERVTHHGRRYIQDLAGLMQPHKSVLGYDYVPSDLHQYAVKRSGRISAQVIIDMSAPAKLPSWLYKGVSSLPPLTGIGLVVGYDSELGRVLRLSPLLLDQVEFAVEWW